MSTALVLGASGGLGKAFTERLSSRGRVVTHGHTTEPPLGTHRVMADLTTSTGRATLIEATAPLAPFDVVVFAFGRVGFAPHTATTDSDLADMFALHALAPLALVRDLATQCSDGAVFVCCTGAVLERPTLQMGAYSAAKGAFAAALPVLRREFRSRRFRFLDVRLPHCETPLATNPLFGSAPTLPPGVSPTHVADVVVEHLDTGAELLLPEHFAH